MCLGRGTANDENPAIQFNFHSNSTGRQTDKQPDSRTDRQTDGQTQTNTETNRYGDKQTQTGIRKTDLPRSKVIPLSLLSGCLSKLAVDAVVLKALAAERTRLSFGLRRQLHSTYLKTSFHCQCDQARPD